MQVAVEHGNNQKSDSAPGEDWGLAYSGISLESGKVFNGLGGCHGACEYGHGMAWHGMAWHGIL